MSAELQFKRYLRDAANQMRKRAVPSVAKLALDFEEQMAQEIEEIERREGDPADGMTGLVPATA